MGVCVFGPVPSRRLGRSLGIDLVPHKTCTFDCIYCQVGRTTRKTIERREWVPLDEVIRQLEARLSTAPEYISISGSGEPTLYSRLGELITRIKSMTKIPVAVLTNGSLLWMPAVRHDLLDADVVMPSLDAPDEGLFRHVNRPHPHISFQKLIKGLVDFRKEYKGQLWLEVFLVAGVTGLDAEVKKLAEYARMIDPDRIQLNTVVRPSAEEFALPVPTEELERFRDIFGPKAEVIADFRSKQNTAEAVATPEDVLNLIVRRPCTIVEVSNGLGISPDAALKLVEALLERKKVESEPRGNALFFRAAH